jgi:cytochrome oxidase assembly protein ShyY1
MVRRFLGPRWLLAHLAALLVVAVLVSLGVWQLNRLDERRARNDLIEARLAMAAEPVVDLADLGDRGDALDDLRFRPVTASGAYDGETTAVRTTQDGVTGAWVFSTLDAGGGELVVVLRGFAFLDEDGSVPDVPPPAGDILVEGTAVPIERLPRTAETAVGRLVAGRTDVLPVAVQASPAEDALQPVPLPDLDEGPHLAYAVQWFLFAAVAAVGYPTLLRRRG